MIKNYRLINDVSICIRAYKWIIVCLTIVFLVTWIVWYFFLAMYVVYAVTKETEDKGEREVVYRSMFFDKAKEKYLYLNYNKEEGVVSYILINKEEGNSLIPF